MKKKFSVKKKLLSTLLLIATTSAIATGAIYTANTVNTINNFQENPSNKIFERAKIERDLEYYGGDDRYIDSNFNLFNILSKNKTEYCNHLDTKNNSSIIVGYDKTTVSKDVATQFNYTIEHINYLFNIINPSYKFISGYYDEKQSDIFVSFKEIPLKIFKSNTSNVASYVDWDFDSKNTSVLKSAKIFFNCKKQFVTPQLRYYLLHEMMHVLYGSPDVDYTKSLTFSVYNYCDLDYIVKQIAWAYESVEDYKNNKLTPLDKNILPYANGSNMLKPFLPLLTLEEKNSFVSLLPTDLSTLISIYGDSSKIENKKAYIELLQETLEKNKKIFDIDYSQFGLSWQAPIEQAYYEDDFELPQI